MVQITLDQDAFGGKRGEVVDVTAAQALWARHEGYAHDGTAVGADVAGQPVVGYTATSDQLLAANRANPTAAHQVNAVTGTKASSTNKIDVPEGFDPDSRTVAQVGAYVSALPSGAGKTAELERIKALEADGQARAGILSL